MCAGSLVDRPLRDAGTDAHTARRHINRHHLPEATQVDHHPGAHRTGRHAAPRPARNKSNAVPLGPRHEQRDIVDIGRHRDRLRYAARDPGTFSVARTRGEIRAEDPAEPRGGLDQRSRKVVVGHVDDES